MNALRENAIAKTDLPLPLLGRGKVRDIYDAGEGRLLLIASDRISAFDVVLDPPIPRKGSVLTQITAWWLARVGDLTPHHLITADPATILHALPGLESSYEQWAGRAMLVRHTDPIPVECVMRGYIAGSAWREYERNGTLAGEPLPDGLAESQRLRPPIFSPATKAVDGHDENITFNEMAERIGGSLAARLRQCSRRLYVRGRDVAGDAGIIIADTKFEFGKRGDGSVLLIDEVLTPDSSRFWPEESYKPARSQPSLDKQPVRDYLDGFAERGEWDRTAPAPELPDEVVHATTQRYLDLFRRLTGFDLDTFPMDRPGAPRPE